MTTNEPRELQLDGLHADARASQILEPDDADPQDVLVAHYKDSVERILCRRQWEGPCAPTVQAELDDELHEVRPRLAPHRRASLERWIDRQIDRGEGSRAVVYAVWDAMAATLASANISPLSHYQDHVHARWWINLSRALTGSCDFIHADLPWGRRNRLLECGWWSFFWHTRGMPWPARLRWIATRLEHRRVAVRQLPPESPR